MHAPSENGPAHVHAQQARAGEQPLAQRVRARVRGGAGLRVVLVLSVLIATVPLRAALCSAAVEQAAKEPQRQREQRGKKVLRLLAHEPEHEVGQRARRVRKVPPGVHVLAQQQLPLAGRRVQPVLGRLALVSQLEGALQKEVHGQRHRDADQPHEKLICVCVWGE
jgi:hypothetical protein